MSEVNRYNLVGYDDFRNPYPASECECADGEYVRADEAISELAALREELARKDVVIEDMVESNCDMGQFLAAAEQRNAELEAAIKPFADYAENTGCPAELGVYGSKGSFEITRADWKSIASIKPTESGASE